MQRSRIQFTIEKPFSLKATALGHGWHECAPFSWCEAAGCLQVIERCGDMPVRLSFTEVSRNRRSVRLALTVEAEALDKSIRAIMRRRAAVMLGLDRDLSAFYALAAEHPKLAPVIDVGAGRLLRSASMTENIIKTICATNVNWTQAVKMINRIAQLGPCPRHFRSQNAWPTPSEILAAGSDYLLNVARVGYRTDAILTLCRNACDGSFDPDSLDTLAQTASTDELYRKLVSIKGIGPTSAGFLLSLLGRFDRMSVDSWTIAYVAENHMKGRKPTVRQIERIYERYGDWRQLVWWFEQWLTWDTARSMLDGQ